MANEALEERAIFAKNGVNARSRDNQYAIISPTTHCVSERASSQTKSGALDVGDARLHHWDMDRLLTTAATKTRRLLGAVYPRDRWWVRAGAAVVNLTRRMKRTDFRVYVHSPAMIDDVLRRERLTRRSLQRTFLWEIVTYVRAAM